MPRPTPRAPHGAELAALNSVIDALRELDEETRQRIIEAAMTFLGTAGAGVGSAKEDNSVRAVPPDPVRLRIPFSENAQQSPKDFLLDKQPRTDVERVACLAYYLTYFRETPHFKTVDLSLLNTEAAQPKFSNAAYASQNAATLGYLVPAKRGQRQLSAIGERFVRALPDREAAKSVFEAIRRHSRAKRRRMRSVGRKKG